MALICKMPLSENLWGPYISTDKGFANCKVHRIHNLH